MTPVASVPGCKQTFHITQHEVIEVIEAITETTVFHYQYTKKHINLTGSTAFSFLLYVLRTRDDGSQIHLPAVSITWNQTFTINYCKTKCMKTKKFKNQSNLLQNKLQFQMYHSGFVKGFPAVYIEKWIKNSDIETLNSNRIC
jgi:hypothetical protein